MNLTEEQIQQIAQEEDVRWCRVHASVVREVLRTQSDYQQDRKLARELTSELVASTRDEDKAALASDEAVAHGLTKLRKNKSDGLSSLVEQPYFARVVTQEAGREVEFRLGTASYPDERIIDWRKAPISKLYYDYKEGDAFSEVIQGSEREGVIKTRRAFQGVEARLNVIELPQGRVSRTEQGWKLEQKGEKFSRAPQHDGHLPPILSLITSDQFALITRDPQKPIFIQGIAGSGKTTVALHRLAWLLHEDNSSARPERCLVVMFNRSLKAYVETTLPELKIPKLPIMTFGQWVNQLVGDMIGPRPRGVFPKSSELERFKSSSQCLKWMQRYIEESPKRGKNFVDDLLQFFAYLATQRIDWPRWDVAVGQLQEQIAKRLCDLQDDALILHLIYAEHGYYPAKSAASLGVCDHIVIDEAQDFGVVEIRALLNAVDRERTVTIVGDTAQKIVTNRDFDSWEVLLAEAGFEKSAPLFLTVSFRSTIEILELANKLRDPATEAALPSSAQRHGPTPIFIQTDNASSLAHTVGQWITARQTESRRTLCALICRWPKQAQQLVEELRKIGYPSVRLGHRDQFEFSPGITVTNVHQVKGLEFRNVLVVEPSEENYHGTSEEERNLLYVAVTRAEHRLDFIGSQKPTALLAGMRRVKGDEIAAWLK